MLTRFPTLLVTCSAAIYTIGKATIITHASSSCTGCSNHSSYTVRTACGRAATPASHLPCRLTMKATCTSPVVKARLALPFVPQAQCKDCKNANPKIVQSCMSVLHKVQCDTTQFLGSRLMLSSSIPWQELTSH